MMVGIMDIIRLQDQFYILATSSRVDDRTRVLKHGDTFAVFDRFGDMASVGMGELGPYHEGTRFVSRPRGGAREDPPRDAPRGNGRPGRGPVPTLLRQRGRDAAQRGRYAFPGVLRPSRPAAGPGGNHDPEAPGRPGFSGPNHPALRA